MAIDTFSRLLKDGFQLVRNSLVTATPLCFNDLVRKTIKIALRTVGDGTNHAR
jgi:hypothetical protein